MTTTAQLLQPLLGRDERHAADPHQFITQIRRPSTCVSVGRGNSDTRPSDKMGDFSISLMQWF